MKRIVKAFFLILLFAGCNNSALDLNNDYTDPDPDDIGNLLEIPENVFLIVNISDPNGPNGQIRGFDSSDLTNSPILAENAATDGRFSRISISDDCQYLLYAKINELDDAIIDLAIKNLNYENIGEKVIQSGISSNESGFINNDFVYFTHGGNINTYEISTEEINILVSHKEYRCNHFPAFSPEKDRVVFKDQDPYKTNIASHAWSTVPAGFKAESADYNSILAYSGDNPVGLYDNFFYSWRDNNHVIFKSRPGLYYQLWEQDVESDDAQPTNADIQYNGINALFEKIQLSPDSSRLLLYGYKGVYIIDLIEEETMAGVIEAEQLYYSSNKYTQFAIFSSDSQYLLVATDRWIGLYDCDSMNKTLFSLSDYLTEDTHIYALTQTSNWDK